MASAGMIEAGVGQAPGKLIVLGEHAVVHGAPAIAVPFGAVFATARLTRIDGPSLLDSDTYTGPLTEAACPPAMAGLVRVAARALQDLGLPRDGWRVRLDSTIPFARGLGSSAAVALAIVRAIHALAQRPLTAPEARALVHEAERAAHGNPSGVDAEAVTAEGPIWFRRGQAAEPLELQGRWHLVVADSGQARDTRRAVAAVQARLEADAAGAQAIIGRLAELADSARRAFAAGEPVALGRDLDAAHAALCDLGVSAPPLEQLITAATHAGALGAKLTGAGCGGCIFALAPDAPGQTRIAEALRAAGASAVWCETLEAGRR